MAKVVMFPQKKKLPKVIEERLCEIAKEYVETIQAAVVLMDLESDEPTQEEMMDLVATAFMTGIIEAIDDVIEES